VEAFKNGEGKELQEALIAKDKLNKHTNYVSGPWFDMYLKDRRPVVLNHNPFMVFADDPRKEGNDQLLRATNFVVSSLRFMKTLRANVLEPEIYHLDPEKSDNQRFRRFVSLLPKSVSWYGAYWYKAFPLDMSQYGNLFNATRIPRAEKDELFVDPTKKHLLVLRNGNLFVFDVLDRDGNIRPAAEIMAQLRYILADKSPTPGYPIGVLTTERRDVWSRLREKLQAAGNEETLKLIDSAVFALSLEDSESDDPNELSRLFLYGDPANRWFDKSFTLIMTKTGRTAVNFEHSWGDGVAVLRYMVETFKDTTQKMAASPGTQPATSSPEIRKLDVKLTDELKQAITEAKHKHDVNTSKLDLDYMQCKKFGKEYLKKKKLSPDSFMQLAFQMAYFKLTGGKTAATYESCSTAAFKHGRTETVRSATIATAKTCAMFHRPAASRPSAAELRASMHECTAKHNLLTKEAATGQGFDRHLLGLKQLALERGDGTLPELYRDPSYTRINHIILSTSTLSNPAIQFGGFAPVVPDGFGVGYSAENEYLGCNVTSFPPASVVRPFLECVQQSFDDMFQVLETTSEPKIKAVGETT
jgi:carnitine O-palmitoyltransferase 2